MKEEEIKEYLKNCTGCLRCEYFLGEDELGWGHCKLRDELDYIKNNKSNEEILKEFKEQIDSGNDYIHLWWKNAQGLLDLYEKEKEKNMDNNEIEKFYISKDKIREILNKLRKKWDEYTSLGNPLILKVQIDLLESLLEEE